MAWFKRTEKGITTPTEDKKDVPKGLWYKTPTGKVIDTDELARNLWVIRPDQRFLEQPCIRVLSFRVTNLYLLLS